MHSNLVYTKINRYLNLIIKSNYREIDAISPRVILKIQTFLQKNLQTVDVMSNY